MPTNRQIKLRLEDLAKDFAREHKDEVAIMALRYECMRKLTPRKFMDIFHRNIVDGTHMDEIIDELVIEWGDRRDKAAKKEGA